jgi:hypothetical protein
MIDFVVTAHDLHEAEGVYRLEVSRVLVTDPDPDAVAAAQAAAADDPTVEIPQASRQTLEVRDFLFSATDDRWFDGDNRRPLADVAPEQRAEVLWALTRAPDEAPAEAPAETPVPLPGVGESLLG